MKGNKLVLTAVFAILLGVFLPAATSHAAELKDSDESTVKWEDASKEDNFSFYGRTGTKFTFQNSQSYSSYDEAIISLAKLSVDAVADKAPNNFCIEIPFTMTTKESIDDEYEIPTKVDDKINNWLRFGNNLTKKEIISFSDSDGSSHENLSIFSTYIKDFKTISGGYSATFQLYVCYQTKYDYDTYEKECFDAIKEMDVAGKSDYDKAYALCKWVNKHIKYDLNYANNQSGVYGMIDGKGVCSAYATLSCYLGRCLGLDILFESGDVWNDRHAWDLVKVDNEWYYIDPTNAKEDYDDMQYAFLQGNDWLKCNVETVDSKFTDYKEKYNIQDLSYLNKHSECNGEHTWTKGIIQDATHNGEDSTCTLPYTMNYRCTKCNAYKWEYYKDPKGHTFGDDVQITPATCTTDGKKTGTCTVCGKSVKETIPATGHQHTKTINQKDATCTSQGYSGDLVCTDCNTTLEEGHSIVMLDHKYGDPVVTEPTCTNDGESVQTCTVCGHKITTTTKALGHDYKVVSTTPATCKEFKCDHEKCSRCGDEKDVYDYDSPLAKHKWDKENSNSVTCTVCGKTHNHAWVEDTSLTKPATCTQEGSKTYYCVNDYTNVDRKTYTCDSTKTEVIPKTEHTWKDGKCTVCGATHDHKWDEGTVTKAATCTEDGVKTYTCSLCDETKTEVIPATGHTWTSEKIGNNPSHCKCTVCGTTKEHTKKVLSVDDPTCTTAGVYHWQCEDCGQRIKGTDKEHPALGHDWSNEDGKCTRCGETHTHSWNDGTLAKDATCTENGEKVYTCSTCDYKKTEVIKATGHQTILKNKKDADCANEGYTGDEVCTVCGQTVKKGTTIAKTNEHKWNSGKVTKETTCTSKGEKTYTCDVCGTAKTEEIPLAQHKTTLKNKKDADCANEGYTGDEVCTVCGQTIKSGTTIGKTNNHKWNEGKVTKEATCTSKGEKTYTCDVCGTTKTEEIPTTEHKFTVTNKKDATCTEDGYTGDKTCEICKTVVEGEAIPATGHTEETVNAKKSTCTSKGYTGDTVCKVCGTVLEKGQELPLAQHSWNKGKVTKAATYWTTGVKTFTCTVCGNHKTTTLAKLTMPKAGTKYVVGGNTYAVTKVGLEVSFSKANTKAKSITVPNTIKVSGITYKVISIGANTFKNCKKLTSVTIGTNVAKITNSAFNNCPTLKTVTIKTVKLTKKTTSKKAFNKVNKKMVIKVPKKVKKTYAVIFKGLTVK